MYIPKYYRKEDRETILEFMKENDFAALVTYDGQKPIATHLLVEVVGRDDAITIYGHMARANPQRKTFGDGEALLIFQGPHTYVSATWYNHVNAPTWNCMIVHAYGKVREVLGIELHSLLSRLVVKQEPDPSYRVETLPEDFVNTNMKAIFGFALEVTRLEAAYKLSQNRDDEDHANIILELEKREDGYSRQIAKAMREDRPKEG